MVFDVPIKEDPRRGLHPNLCRPRRPTGPAPNAGLVPSGATAPIARDLVGLGRLQVQRWQCKACLGSSSPLPPGVTAHQRP